MKALEENDCFWCELLRDVWQCRECGPDDKDSCSHAPGPNCPYRLIESQAKRNAELEGQRDEMVEILEFIICKHWEQEIAIQPEDKIFEWEDLLNRIKEEADGS